MSTSSLLAKELLKPRAVMAQVFELTRATSSPGAMRRASGMQVAPLRRIISLVITNTAAAERPTVPCSLVTDVTGMSIEGTTTGVLASWSMSRLRMSPASLGGPLAVDAAAGGCSPPPARSSELIVVSVRMTQETVATRAHCESSNRTESCPPFHAVALRKGAAIRLGGRPRRLISPARGGH